MKSKDPCPLNCGGQLRARTGKPSAAGWHEQRLECNRCGHKAGKAIVPAAAIWKRTKLVSVAP